MRRLPPSTTCSVALPRRARRIFTSFRGPLRRCGSTATSTPLTDAGEGHAGRHARPSLPHPLHGAAEAARSEPAARLFVRRSRSRALSCERPFPARLARRRLPAHSGGVADARGARAADVPSRARDAAARSRPRHRPDGLGQVDDARLDGGRGQPAEATPHPHHRGSDRVRAPAQALRRHAARDRRRRTDLRRSACAPRCARTPT